MTGALDRDYQVCEQIGRGRFSIGFRCTSWIWGKSFAFKSIDKNLISGDSLDSQCILTEPKILQLLNPHHKIVQIFAVYENQFHFDIMLEFCNSQDLFSEPSRKMVLIVQEEIIQLSLIVVLVPVLEAA
ncbi:hypothetical protein CUMW_173750, partial [Citrus unshiu]